MERTQQLDEAVGQAFMTAVHAARAKLLEISQPRRVIDVEAVRQGDCSSLDIDACNDAIFPVWDNLVLEIFCLCAHRPFPDPAIRAQWDVLSQAEKLVYGIDFAFSYKNFVRCVVSATFFRDWRRSLGRPNQVEAN